MPQPATRPPPLGNNEYISRVRAQIEVHAGDPDQPERATLELTRALLAGFPRRRSVTLALVGFAPHPGLTPTPWALDGVLEACVEAERTPLNLLTIADAATGEALLRKTGRVLLGGADGRDLVERPSRDRSLTLRSRGQKRPFVIPREVVGSSLVIVTPMLARAREVGRARHWQGPLALALEQLATAWGYAPAPPKLSSGLRPRADDDGREATAAGLELIAASFASAALILDATWAGAIEAAAEVRPSGRTRGPDGRFVRSGPASPNQSAAEPPRLLGELASPDRCLGVHELERLDLDATLGVDHWLVRVLGLSRRESDLPIPKLGERSPGRWPQLDISEPRSQPKRLADRAISGIRSQSKRLVTGIGGLGATGSSGSSAREQPALPARVSGRFAQQWTARWYGEHERLGR
jgi:hypothetical protein